MLLSEMDRATPKLQKAWQALSRAMLLMTRFQTEKAVCKKQGHNKECRRNTTLFGHNPQKYKPAQNRTYIPV